MTTSQPLSDDEANEILGYDLFDLTEIGPEETFPWENRYHLPNHPWKSSKSPIFKAIGYKSPSDLPMKMEDL
jgi:hypothetical protein